MTSKCILLYGKVLDHRVGDETGTDGVCITFSSTILVQKWIILTLFFAAIISFEVLLSNVLSSIWLLWCAKLCTLLFATLQHFTDVEDVKFVINYDYPNSSEDYIHRIGRTARSTKTGTAYTFFTPNNIKQVNDLISVLREANQAINPKLLQLIEDRGSGKYCS